MSLQQLHERIDAFVLSQYVVWQVKPALAQQKAEDMAKNQYFSHTSPTYGSAFDMLKAAGYSYKTAGENIAMGQKSAASVMDGWMHSSGHRANILHTSYEKIGVGYAVSADGMPYWVQIFAG